MTPQIILADHAGFCFGVRRAVEKAEMSAPNVTLGAIINNPQAVKTLEEKGVRAAESMDEIPDGARAVIRSHGVGRAETEKLEEKCREVVDATCPFVTRIHLMARTAAEKERPLIVIGEREHPEVMGTLGWAGDAAYAVMSPEDVRALPEHLRNALVVSQTTITRDSYDALSRLLAEKYPDAEITCTICTATSDRQSEAVELAKRCDVMIVIGGRESSNSKKLYELTRAICERTHFIETAQEAASICVRGKRRHRDYSRRVHAGLYN